MSGATSTIPAGDHVAPRLATSTNVSPPDFVAPSGGLLLILTSCACGSACFWTSHSPGAEMPPAHLSTEAARQLHAAATDAWFWHTAIASARPSARSTGGFAVPGGGSLSGLSSQRSSTGWLSSFQPGAGALAASGGVAATDPDPDPGPGLGLSSTLAAFLQPAKTATIAKTSARSVIGRRH